MAADAGELKARATLDNAEFLSSLKDMVSQIQSSSENAANGVGKMTEAFGQMVEAAGVAELSKKIAEFASDCIDAAVQVNKLAASFDILAGSAEQSRETFEAIKDLSLHSVFDFADVLGPAAQQMMLVGVSAEQTTETMRALVDAASGLKQGPDWINNVSGAIDGMQSRLVASARDMKAFEQAGVDAWGDLAAQLGVSVSQAEEMVKKGMVTAQTVTEAVTEDLKQRFQGSAELAGQTWTGAMKILENSGEEAKEAIGNSILSTLNAFAPVLMQISQLVQDAAQWWTNLSQPVKDVALAVGAAIPAIVAISTALPILGAALGVVAAAFTGPVAPIVALIAALGLIGKWVYEEWPAIKAVFIQLWDDIVAGWKALWSGVGGWFSSAFGGIATLVGQTWTNLKSIVGGVVDWLVEKFEQFFGMIGGWIQSLGKWAMSIPAVANTVNSLTDAWSRGQKAIADNKTAVDAHTKAIKDNAAQTQATINARKQQEAADLAQSNAEKAAAAQQAKDDAAAKKAAAEQLAYNEALKKTYDALYAVAPATAQAFAAMYGGINESATNAEKIMGSAWATASAATRQLVTDTLALADAYKSLGVTGLPALEGAADKAGAAYTLLATSGKTSAAEQQAAFDALVTKQQAIATMMNTTVADAYKQGAITEQEYYDGLVANSQKALDQTTADMQAGLAVQANVDAARQVLANAQQAQAAAVAKAYGEALNAVGVQTDQQLDAAIQKWSDYSDAIGKSLGTDSAPYIKAQIGLLQQLIAQFTQLGQPIPDYLKNQLKDLQTQLENTKPPLDQLNDAMKTLGATSIESLTQQIQNAADAVARVQNLQKAGLATSADVATAQKKLFDLVGQEVTQYNDQYTPAVQKNDQTQQQAAQNTLTSATEVQASLVGVGNSAEASAAIQVAAAGQTANAWTKLGVAALKTVEDEYKILGVTVTQQLTDSAAKAQKAYDDIAASGTASAVQLQEAWVRNQQIQLQTTVQLGGEVTEAQKNQLAAQEQDLQNHLDITTSQWKTAYDGIHSAVSTMFDDLIKTVVTGKGSFADVMTAMWQSIAEAALKGFLEPVTKAIENFISTTIANLLSGQGLGGVLDSLKQIGSTVTNLFSGGSSLATSSATMGQVGQAIPGVGAAGGAGGAAAGIAGSAGSLLSGVGAVGSVVSAITGIIGDIQNIHMGAQLASIEHNTRYTMMYVGDRADGGILGVLFKIDEELAWGSNTKATENLRDLFKDWSNNALGDLDYMKDMIENGVLPYLPDIKGVLEDIRDIAASMRDSITTGFQQLTVTINAGNLTTAEAARQLGNQIAANLTGQMVAIKG